MSLYQKYLRKLGDPHAVNNNLCNVKSIDFVLRSLIGKTNNLEVAKCSHAKILEHEFPDDENRCRQCGIRLGVGAARWNDYLVLRHPQCKRPICAECAEKRPDIFYMAFKEGLRKYNMLTAEIHQLIKHERVENG